MSINVRVSEWQDGKCISFEVYGIRNYTLLLCIDSFGLIKPFVVRADRHFFFAIPSDAIVSLLVRSNVCLLFISRKWNEISTKKMDESSGIPVSISIYSGMANSNLSQMFRKTAFLMANGNFDFCIWVGVVPWSSSSSLSLSSFHLRLRFRLTIYHVPGINNGRCLYECVCVCVVMNLFIYAFPYRSFHSAWGSSIPLRTITFVSVSLSFSVILLSFFFFSSSVCNNNLLYVAVIIFCKRSARRFYSTSHFHDFRTDAASSIYLYFVLDDIRKHECWRHTNGWSVCVLYSHFNFSIFSCARWMVVETMVDSFPMACERQQH